MLLSLRSGEQVEIYSTEQCVSNTTTRMPPFLVQLLALRVCVHVLELELTSTSSVPC
jgi:hypothetical protein